MGQPDVPQDRYDMLRDLVQTAQRRLEGRKHDVLARRGIFLISAILPEVDDVTETTKLTSRTIFTTENMVS